MPKFFPLLHAPGYSVTLPLTSLKTKIFFQHLHYQRTSGHCLGTFRSVNVFCSPSITTVKVVLLNAPRFIFLLFFLLSYRGFQMANKLREIPAGDVAFT